MGKKSDSGAVDQRVVRLSDLMQDGDELEVPIGVDDLTLKVWIHKLNKGEHDAVVRAANLSVAGLLAVKKLPRTHPDYQEFYAEIDSSNTSDEDLVGILATWKTKKRIVAIREKVMGEEKWSKDGYLQELQEAWIENLEARYAEDPEDVEAKRVLDELDKFGEELSAAIQEQQEAYIEELNEYTPEKIRDFVADMLIDERASDLSLSEYMRLRAYHSVREFDNRSKLYFESVEEYDSCSDAIKAQIDNRIYNLTLSTSELKK